MMTKVVRSRRFCGAARGKHHSRGRVGQHLRQPSLRIVRIEWNVRAAGLEDGQEPHYHLDGSLQANTHQRFRPNA